VSVDKSKGRKKDLRGDIGTR